MREGEERGRLGATHVLWEQASCLYAAVLPTRGEGVSLVLFANTTPGVAGPSKFFFKSPCPHTPQWIQEGNAILGKIIVG